MKYANGLATSAPGFLGFSDGCVRFMNSWWRYSIRKPTASPFYTITQNFYAKIKILTNNLNNQMYEFLRHLLQSLIQGTVRL